MAKMADERPVTHPTRVHSEECQVTVLQASKTVFKAYGTIKVHSIEATGGTRPGALDRWCRIAERADD